MRVSASCNERLRRERRGQLHTRTGESGLDRYGINADGRTVGALPSADTHPLIHHNTTHQPAEKDISQHEIAKAMYRDGGIEPETDSTIEQHRVTTTPAGGEDTNFNDESSPPQ